MTDITASRLPSDLAAPGLHIDDCVYGHVSDGIPGSVASADTPRATVIGRFAQECGIAFRDVSCTVAYARFLTRQDVWEESAMDRAASDRIDDLGLICKHDPSRGEGLAAFWYEDTAGREVPESEFEPPPHPPADWEPGELDYVWTTCKKDAPGAFKIYICEKR